MWNVLSILAGAAVLLIMLVVRRKMYKVSWKKMIVIHVVMTIVTTLGANLGSYLGGMSFLGLRLYGFLILDTLVLLIMPKFFGMKIGELGDYLAASIIAVCSIVKVPCLINGCCYGIEWLVDSTGNSVRFPSQIVEFCIWAMLTVWLYVKEKKGLLKNLLWPVAAIWFGIFRFLVDFMRGNPKEMQLVILGLPGGRFWSLVVALMGIVMLFFSIRKYYATASPLGGMMKAIVGMAPTKVEN